MSLKEFRISKLLSQREFANLIGVTQAALTRIETHKCNMSVKTLKKIALAFNLNEQERISLYNDSCIN